MAIRVLPPEIANRIAAGEVVERPASVVKELIENSIDAGADDIQVEIQDGGRRLIRVADNGSGILVEDTAIAFSRHATSKLQRAEDLERIVTLGFRGEALASIAAVSRLTMSTRSIHEEMGTLVELDGGRLLRREPIGRPAGTTVTVEHLFYNVPARLKFLRSPITEAGHISELVIAYALAYPALRFRLVSNGRLLFRSDGTGEMRDVLLQAYGPEMVRQLLAIEPAMEPADEGDTLSTKVRGFIGVPSLHRADRQHMLFFVNGRPVTDRSLSYAVIQAYHTLLPAGRYPVAILAIELEPAEVDVNVHPTKSEVRFREPGRIFALVQRQVRATLVNYAPIPSLHIWSPPLPHVEGQEAAGWNWERRRKLVEAGAQQAALTMVPPSPATLESQPTADIEGAGRLPILRVIGQLRQMYILAEGPEGLYLIDQHAAHERVLYEHMMAQKAQEGIVAQQLLEPHVLTLDLRPAGILMEHMPALERAGFVIEPFGERAFLLRAVPAPLGMDRDPSEALLAIIEELEHGEAPLSREQDAQVIAAICKQAAIKAGQTLSHAEMVELIRQLESTDSPRTCPHGRPSMIHLSAEHLAKQFGRTGNP